MEKCEDTIRPEIVDGIEAVEWVGEERPEDEVACLRERDWGANLFASHLVRQLGIGGYVQVTVIRSLLDEEDLMADLVGGLSRLRSRPAGRPAPRRPEIEPR